MIRVEVTGLDELRQVLAGFSDRRFNAAVATSLTRTARDVSDAWRTRMRQVIDRPTPGVMRSPTMTEMATAQQLTAVVKVSDKPMSGGAESVAERLLPHEFGGDRSSKKFERALQAQASMPRGLRAVPSAGAELDSYGNVRRQQLVQVIAQLGTDYSPGYQRVIAKSVSKRMAKAKATGKQYVAISKATGLLKPGVYRRDGRGLVPVFLFVRVTFYAPRLSLKVIGMKVAAQQLEKNMSAAIEYHINQIKMKAAR